jgi:hypothetical protein
LIDTIASANDQKSILELRARIAAEGGMLENEHTKFETLPEHPGQTVGERAAHARV